jgi:WD40 repeat protein
VAGGRLDGRDVIVGGREDGVVLLWRADERSAPSVALTGHTASIIDIAVGRFGGRTLIATCSDDCTVRVWDARTLHTEHVLDLLARPEAVAFAKSGKIVVAVGYGVCVFDP